MPEFKRIIFCTFLFFFNYRLMAQDFGLQVSPGIINYGGDLESSVYTFHHAGFSIGAGLFYRINKFSLRSGFNIGKIHSDDYNYTDNKNRNLSFSSGIFDVNLVLQYDFFSMDEKKFTPYCFAGAGVYHFNPYTYYNSQKIYLRPLGTEGQGMEMYPGREMYVLTQLELPYGIGIKYKLNEHFLVSLEFSNRYLFTDYLDDVSNTYPDETELFKKRGQLAVDLSFRGDELDLSRPFPSGAQRGNPHRNDDFYFSTVSFIYVFPKNIGFNSFGKRNSRNFHLSCPKPVQ